MDKRRAPVKPKIVPFEIHHLTQFINRDTEQVDDGQMAMAMGFDTSPSYTIMAGDKVLGCAGVLLLGYGFGVAWMALSKDIEQYGMFLARTARSIFRCIVIGCELKQVESLIPTDSLRGQMWVAYLGFTRQDTYTRYVWVKRPGGRIK